MIKQKPANDFRTLMNLAELKAEQLTDGHLALFRFATHWRAMLGTPGLDKEGRERVRNLGEHETLEEALKYLIVRPK